MVNHRRGDAELVLDGRRYILRLTLGALAELETAFQVADLAALGERFATGRLSARDVIVILGCALRGGGHAIRDEEVAALHAEGGIAPLAEAALRALEAAFGAGTSPNPPPAQAG
jgi:hypothetical protein